LKKISSCPEQSYGFFYFRVICHKLRSQGNLCYCPVEGIVRLGEAGTDAVDVFRIFMIAIKTQIVKHIEDEEKTSCDTDGQTEYIDQAVGRIPEKIPEGDPDKAPKHVESVY